MEPLPLCPEEAEQGGAVWSPDGSSIAFTTNRNGTHAVVVASVLQHARNPGEPWQ